MQVSQGSHDHGLRGGAHEVPGGQTGHGTPHGAMPASASKVHPVAVVAEHVEDPIGRQGPRSSHETEHNAGGRARGRGPPAL